MARNLVLLVAILAAGMTAISTAQAEKDLNPKPSELQWDGWNVKISELYLTDTVERYKVEKAAADSIFVYLDLAVQNISHTGNPFIPQNVVKIIVGDNAFDAADLDVGSNYTNNIEPTLSRERKCYFELPRNLVKDSLVIRFSRLLVAANDVNVSISEPKPTPTPIVLTDNTKQTSADVTPVVSTLPPTNVVSAITGNRWTPDALIVSGTLTNASAVAVRITGIDVRGFNQDQKFVFEGSDYTIVHNDLAPSETVNFKVALKDGTKQVKYVKVTPSWSP